MARGVLSFTYTNHLNHWLIAVRSVFFHIITPKTIIISSFPIKQMCTLLYTSIYRLLVAIGAAMGHSVF